MDTKNSTTDDSKNLQDSVLEGRALILFLLHMHDHIWADKTFPLPVRRDACQIVKRIVATEYLHETRQNKSLTQIPKPE